MERLVVGMLKQPVVAFVFCSLDRASLLETISAVELSGMACLHVFIIIIIIKGYHQGLSWELPALVHTGYQRGLRMNMRLLVFMYVKETAFEMITSRIHIHIYWCIVLVGTVSGHCLEGSLYRSKSGSVQQNALEALLK